MKWMIIMVLTIMAIPVMAEKTDTYDYSSEMHCDNRKCNTMLYSGVRFVPEKGTWIKIEEARSLKGTPITVEIIKDDGINGLRIVDYNYSCVKIEPYAKDIMKYEYGKSIPIKVSNITKGYVTIPGVLSPLNSIELCSDEGMIYKTITFGKESTTVEINDNITGNLEDSEVRKDYPTTNYGTDNSMMVVWVDSSIIRSSVIMWNLSSIPENAGVTDAKMYLKPTGASTYNATVSNISTNAWNETNITWNNMISRDKILDTKEVVGGEITWWNITKSIDEAKNNTDKRTSFYINRTELKVGSYPSFWTKEASTVSSRPYLNITYELDDILISIQEPTNQTHYESNMSINYTWAEYNLVKDKCFWKLNNTNYQEISECRNFSYSFSFGSNNVTIKINDTSGGEHISETRFFEVKRILTWSQNQTNATCGNVEFKTLWNSTITLDSYNMTWCNGQFNETTNTCQSTAGTSEYINRFEQFEGTWLPENTTTAGTLGFFNSTFAINGSFSAESGNISDNQLSMMNITVTVPSEANVSWTWNVSSEYNYDFICFCDNKNCSQTGCTCSGSSGTADARLSSATNGVMRQAKASKNITAGKHSLIFCYRKDASDTYGRDAGIVDDINVRIYGSSTTTYWINENWTKFTNGNWSNFTRVVNDTIGSRIGWKQSANNSESTTNTTGYSWFITTDCEEEPPAECSGTVTHDETAHKIIIPAGCRYVTNERVII